LAQSCSQSPARQAERKELRARDRSTPGSNDPPCITVKTDANGEAKVKFECPLTGSIDNASYGTYRSGIAGYYTITARAREASEGGPILETKASTDVMAQVDGLEPLKPSADLEEGRGGTGAHPQGSYGTAETLQAFASLAADFHEVQDEHNAKLAKCGRKQWKPIQPLSTNDIALHDGGIFDWQSTWAPSHQTHNKGEGATSIASERAATIVD
jgi:hypothetical protein